MGWQLQLARFTQAHRIAPARFLKWSNQLTADYYFGIRSKQESELLKKIIQDTDLHFMQWAIHQIMKWKNKSSEKVMHIHGTADRIFPKTSIKNYIPIEKGGHFMIVNEAEKISQIINKVLEKSHN